ncbi:HpcH/HpaI aldolase/citrate lyase family protein [Brevibacterium litoralis]|uniref:HpcH/HpaI aldolase/citrate lyase family protein n=1 Tax=Brevibacterium litoralis TaxID=3138935 RepID=UPI0032F08F67
MTLSTALDSARTLLFVPAARPDRFDKALTSGADAIVIDLEDAVAPADKDTARTAIVDWLRTRDRTTDTDTLARDSDAEAPAAVLVRTNQSDSPWFAQDVAALAAVAKETAGTGGQGTSPAEDDHAPFGVMLPKTAEDAPLVAIRSAFREAGAGTPYLVGLLETPVGIVRAEALAQGGLVDRLAFGNYDLALELDARVTAEEIELLHARSRVVLAARAFGMPGPIDGPCADFSTPGATESSATRGRDLGFAGKLAIHPRQVPVIEEKFADSAEDVDWARRVVEAAGDADGAAVSVDGKMVDAPVLKRAERILARA